MCVFTGHVLHSLSKRVDGGMELVGGEYCIYIGERCARTRCRDPDCEKLYYI